MLSYARYLHQDSGQIFVFPFCFIFTETLYNIWAGGRSGGLPGGGFSLAFKAALLRFTEADTEFAEFRWWGPKAEAWRLFLTARL